MAAPFRTSPPSCSDQRWPFGAFLAAMGVSTAVPMCWVSLCWKPENSRNEKKNSVLNLRQGISLFRHCGTFVHGFSSGFGLWATWRRCWRAWHGHSCCHWHVSRVKGSPQKQRSQGLLLDQICKRFRTRCWQEPPSKECWRPWPPNLKFQGAPT